MSTKQTKGHTDTAHVVNELNQLTIMCMEKRIEELEEFVRYVLDNLDCDTGADGAHHHCCRTCSALKLLPKEGLK